MAQTGHVVQGEAARRRTTGVQAVQLAAMPNQRKRITAYTVGGGFHHSQGGRGGNGGINGVAAGLQYSQPGLCGQRLRGGDHAAIGINHRTAGGVRVMGSIKV